MPPFELIFRYDDGREVTETGEGTGVDDLPPRDRGGTPLWPGETLVAMGARWSVEYAGEKNGQVRWICRQR